MRTAVLKEAEKCSKCGVCLGSCPVYALTAREEHSPRGKVHLARELLTGRLPYVRDVTEVFDYCLTCYKCDVVCPRGVAHNVIWVGMRGELSRSAPTLLSKVKKLGLDALNYDLVVGALSKVAPLLGRFFGQKTRGVRFGAEYGGWHGDGKVKVLLFPDLLADLIVQNLAVDLLDFLIKAGFSVYVPSEPLYSGVPEINNGVPELARRRAEEVVQFFGETDCDYVVSPDETFVSAYTHDYGLLGVSLPSRPVVMPFLNFVVRLGLVDRFKGKEEKIYINESCHLFNLQSIEVSPYELLEKVGDVPVMGDLSGRCCGFGGSFSFLHPREGREFALTKFEEAESLGASAILVFSSGCYFHLKRWEREVNSGKIKVIHFCTYLKERFVEQAEG